jgi:putative redox protein
VIPLVINAHGAGVALKFSTGGEKPHTFNTDALPAFGGSDSAPSPLYYALASLGSCNQVTASLVARDLGIRLGSWSINVQGDLDTKVLVQAHEGNANFNRVVVRASVQTDASEEQFARLVAETERRCPISQLYKRSGLVFDNQWERVPLPTK